jgi:hypothetical protein
MISPQQLGINFENEINCLLCLTDKKILREQEIVNIYGNNCFGIDHLIYCDNFIICIQDKWTNKNPSLTDAQHFLSAMRNIYRIQNKRIIAIYISKTPITERAYNEFKNEEKYLNYKFYKLCSENQNIIYKNLMKFLYSLKIYFYDNNEKTNLIMYDETFIIRKALF